MVPPTAAQRQLKNAFGFSVSAGTSSEVKLVLQSEEVEITKHFDPISFVNFIHSSLCCKREERRGREGERGEGEGERERERKLRNDEIASCDSRPQASPLV